MMQFRAYLLNGFLTHLLFFFFKLFKGHVVLRICISVTKGIVTKFMIPCLRGTACVLSV